MNKNSDMTNEWEKYRSTYFPQIKIPAAWKKNASSFVLIGHYMKTRPYLDIKSEQNIDDLVRTSKAVEITMVPRFQCSQGFSLPCYI